MHYTSLKKAVLNYCEHFNLNQPNKKVLIDIWVRYEESLYTAPVKDNDETLCQFLAGYFNVKDMRNKFNTVSAGTISFADFVALQAATSCPPPACVKAKCKPNKEEENSMAYEKTDIAVQREYFNRRLTEARYTKEQELVETFNIRANPTPRNYKELIDFIKNGKYELDTKRTKRIDVALEDNPDEWFNAFDGIKWTGRPSPDHDGYSAAEKEMYKRDQAARDAIMVDPTKGPQIISDFEAWIPVGKSN